MGYRDPRVLSQKLDNNAYNLIPPAPHATSTPEADQEANDSIYTGGYVSAQRINPAAPTSASSEQDYSGLGEGTAVTYETGTPDTNRIKDGNGRDDVAIAPTKNSALLNARGYSSGKGAIGGTTSMGTKPPLSGRVA